MATLTEELLEKLRDDQRLSNQREETQDTNRRLLRDFAVQLREPVEMAATGPASRSQPTFLVGSTPGFPGVPERGEVSPERGHMSPEAHREMLDHLRAAAAQPEGNGRNAAASRAAQTITKDWAHKNGVDNHGKDHNALVQARAQVAYATKELSQSLGLNAAEATMVSHALDHALAKEGFRVMANKVIDGVADYRPSAAGVATAAGMRHQMDEALTKSATALAERGVTREVLKEMVERHSGKFAAVVSVAQNPEMLRHAAQVIAQAPDAIAAFSALAKDKQLRHDVGTVTMATGEAVASVSRGAGSVAILAGAALRGETAEDMGRHAFRAGMAVLGGAAGGVAAGSVSFGAGSVVGAVAGQALGSAVADKVLDAWDRLTGREAAPVKSHLAEGELAQSKANLAERATDAGAKIIDKGTEAVREQVRDRTYGGGRGMEMG